LHPRRKVGRCRAQARRALLQGRPAPPGPQVGRDHAGSLRPPARLLCWRVPGRHSIASGPVRGYPWVVTHLASGAGGGAMARIVVGVDASPGALLALSWRPTRPACGWPPWRWCTPTLARRWPRHCMARNPHPLAAGRPGAWRQLDRCGRPGRSYTASVTVEMLYRDLYRGALEGACLIIARATREQIA